MFKINLSNLLLTLENIGQRNLVTVDDAVKADAKRTIDNMLAI
jgi:quinolinate synthase